MLRGNYAGHILGSGSDSWKFWDERRAGNISEKEWQGVEGGIARSYGTCMTMGTASTMTAIAEALGLSLPGASSIPAADAGHKRMAAACGRRVVDMVWEDLTPDQIITEASVHNALTVAMATGCSTNAIIHLLAMARRAGIELTLDDFDASGRKTPLVANIRPSGKDYLMEDFYYAGGLPALMNDLGDKLDRSAITCTGKTWKTASRTPRSITTTSSGRCRTRSTRKARWRFCAATSAPTAPSSSPPPATRNSTSTKAPRWSSTAIPR